MLEQINDDTEPAGREMVRVLRELQGLKVDVVAGAAANTNINLAGAGVDDTIVSVVRFDVAADTGTSAAGNKVQDVAKIAAAITSAGHIQSAVDTTGDILLVVWFDKSAL